MYTGEKLSSIAKILTIIGTVISVVFFSLSVFYKIDITADPYLIKMLFITPAIAGIVLMVIIIITRVLYNKLGYGEYSELADFKLISFEINFECSNIIKIIYVLTGLIITLIGSYVIWFGVLFFTIKRFI